MTEIRNCPLSSTCFMPFTSRICCLSVPQKPTTASSHHRYNVTGADLCEIFGLQKAWPGPTGFGKFFIVGI